MRSLSETIERAKLTRVGKIIANYILENTTAACFMTSTQLANTLQVSEASIIRFTRNIGFQGYMDFQKYLQKCHLDTITKMSTQLETPSKRYTQSLKHNPDEFHYGIEALKIGDASLRSVFHLNGEEMFEKAIQTIIHANKIYISSGRSNIYLVSRLYSILRLLLPNVYTTAMNTGTAIDHLCDISAGDCLILFSFQRHSHIELTALQMARDESSNVVLISDMDSEHLEMFSKFADVVLRVDTGSNSFFPSMIGVNFLIELLGNGISREIDANVEERMKKIEYYLGQFDHL